MSLSGNNKPRIVVRRARLDDYEAVLDIDRNVYDDLDYLPTMYHTLVQDPNVDPFLIEIDGKVVSISYVIYPFAAVISKQIKWVLLQKMCTHHMMI